MDWGLIFQGIVAIGIILGGLWFVVGLRLSPIEESIKKIQKTLTPIHNFLLKKFPEFNSVVQAGSLKRITEHGQEIIEKYKVEDYLKEKCDLLEKDFSGKTDAEIFIECDKWVKEKGKIKVTEIRGIIYLTLVLKYIK